MSPLSPADRQALKGQAHSLHPVASIGNDGLTDDVVKEIERQLNFHELIKVKAFGDRDERDAWLTQLCEQLGAQSVQHIGKVFVLYRKRPDDVPPPKSQIGRHAGKRAWAKNKEPGIKPRVVAPEKRAKQAKRDSQKRAEQDLGLAPLRERRRQTTEALFEEPTTRKAPRAQNRFDAEERSTRARPPSSTRDEPRSYGKGRTASFGEGRGKTSSAGGKSFGRSSSTASFAAKGQSFGTGGKSFTGSTRTKSSGMGGKSFSSSGGKSFAKTGTTGGRSKPSTPKTGGSTSRRRAGGR